MAPSAIETATSALRRLRPAHLIIGIVAAIVAIGWAYLIANMNRTPGIAAQTIAYRVVDDARVDIKFSITKPKDKEVRCVVRAIDGHFSDVARIEVTVPRGTGTMTRAEQLQTSARAVSAFVRDCRTL